jgi:uncharacterized membrane protein HdeD (DUF308 family)
MNIETTESINSLKLLPNFGRYTTIAGILLILLGIGGIILPQFMSLEASLLIASLFLIGGIFWVIHSFKTHNKEWSEWLKPVLLLISGGLMLLYPMTGIATIGLLLAIYLLLDAYGSFLMAYNLRHKTGWVWMVINGIISLLLATLFLTGWPATSLWLVGLYISISLFFDGWALLSLAWMQRKLSA